VECVLATYHNNLNRMIKKSLDTMGADVVCVMCLGNTPTTLAQFVTFAVYAIMSVARKDEGLLGPQAFASISLINLVTFPVMIFCQALPNCMQAVACFGRVEEYFLKESATSSESSPISLPASTSMESTVSLQQLQTPTTTPSSKEALISFEHADISWSSESPDPVLQDLNLTICPGLTAIIGPVASGKSTLLASIIGETALKNGSIAPPSLSGVAFCAQTPWIMDDTIRQNITGGVVDFDRKWYDFSVESSGLKGDVLRMPAGDVTRAGSNGSSLSGGQRQRVVSIFFLSMSVCLCV